MDGFIKIHDRIRYLAFLDYGRCDKICDRIKYLISKKCDITDSINHNSGRIRVDSYDSLPIKRFYNVTILIKSVVNKNKNNSYHNKFLEKGLYKDKSNT